SFMDLQFPNGQLTYVAGEGLQQVVFFHYLVGCFKLMGNTLEKLESASLAKNKQGTRFTPMFQWPDKSLSFGVTQALAWKRSGLMVRPSVQVSLCPYIWRK
ncbi:hypothetical protein EE612_005498, partial [Oryza sativa]